MSSLLLRFLLFLSLLLPNVCAETEPNSPIDLINGLRLSESSQVSVEYGVNVYSLENSASRPILELDPAINLTSLALRASIRTNYAKRGTLFAITNPNTTEVFLKMYFSQSLYDLYYMMVDVYIANQKFTLNVRSFDANTWVDLIFILTEYRMYLYDRTDCQSGDSESISNVKWPSSLANYSLFLGTSGEDGERVMKGIELSELLLYSGQRPYSHLCRAVEVVNPSDVTWTSGLSGSGDFEMSGSGSGVDGYEATSQTPRISTVLPTSGSNAAGLKGEPGEPGTMGTRGPKGEKGESSIVTQVGLKGAKGEVGADGIAGSPGSDGEKGESGVRGEKGEKGEEIEWNKVEETIASKIGNSSLNSQSSQPTCDLVQSCFTIEMANSIQGEKGVKGDQGDRGERGSEGDLGSKGSKGEMGRIGPTGPSGPPGIQGGRGDTGLTGSKGFKGSPGVTGLPGDSVVGRKGEKGERGDSGEVGVSGLDGASGPPGPRGPLGPHGPPGTVQYSSGVPGNNGSKGDSGVKGDKGQVGAGGRPGNAGLKGENGSHGIKGDMGVIGPPGIGIKGAKGDSGQVNITDEHLISAVNRIPELLSLKGEQGAKGTTGPKGESGRQGFPGIPGSAGHKGEPGTATSGTMVIHARTRQDMAAVSEPGSLVYRSDLEKMAFLSLDGWLEIRASVTPWVEIVDVGETPSSTSQPNKLCGNEVLDGDEECDSTNLNELTCKLLRGDLYEGELRCTSHCTLDLSLCQLSSIVVFGLTTPVSGRLDGIIGADSLCNRESDAGYYKAYIYSFNRNPSTLVPYRYHFLPVKNTLAETMYDSWAEFLRDNILEESRANLVSAGGEALTNSGYWIGARNSNCKNWNSQQATDTALSAIKNSDGFSQSYPTCDQDLSLICVLISF